VFEAYTHSLDSNSSNGKLIQASSSFCGCCQSSVLNHCCICEEGDDLMPKYEKVHIDPFYLFLLGIKDIPSSVTCKLVFGMKFQLEPNSRKCQSMVGQ
jgi:hypothetical protein